MMIIISKILKHWKIGGLALLIIGFAVSFHFAKTRGEELAIAEETIQIERNKFQTQLKMIEKARQDDKERNNFRKSQAKKFKLAENEAFNLDPPLRDAYNSLRERAAGHTAR